MGVGGSSREKNCGVLKLTAHLHLLSRLRISGAIPPFLHMPSSHARNNSIFTLTLMSKNI
jgi:hypothetical protein